jgi:hypothetical protein
VKAAQTHPYPTLQLQLYPADAQGIHSSRNPYNGHQKLYADTALTGSLTELRIFAFTKQDKV